MTMCRLVVRLLGGFEVLVGDRPVPSAAWRHRRAGLLVKLLALAPGYRLHREQAMDLLWPDLSPQAQANNLRGVVHAARARLHAAGAPQGTFLLRDGELLLLAHPTAVQVDVTTFEQAVVRAWQSGETAPGWQAVELYTGDLLPDDLYDEWIAERRGALRMSVLALLERLGQRHAARHETDVAIAAYRRIVAIDPTLEAAHSALMRLYASAGQPAGALAQYEYLHEVLARELGIEPEHETQALAQDIRSGRFPPHQPGGPPAAPATAVDSPPARHTLPALLSDLVGRAREIAEVRQHLSNGRLVTLTGPGGIGKTRLSIAVAHAVAGSFPDGACFVDLAPVRDPELVMAAVAHALEVREQPGVSTRDALRDTLGTKRLLLVLDNFEQVVAAAPAVAALLEAAPEVRAIVTSRQRLRVRGEQKYAVGPLLLPDTAELADVAALSQYAAVSLFIQRAQAARSDFDVTSENAAAIAAICHRLDGLPLAIELAAARVPVLTPQAILARLDRALALLVDGAPDLPDRQRTIRDTIRWSFDLLDHAQQRLLTRMSVFARGCTLAAVEAVCGAEDQDDLLGPLGQLIEASLVQMRVPSTTSEARYTLLETVRQFAAEQLAARGEETALATRHARYMLAVAEAAETGLLGSEQAGWLARLDLELDNIRAALANMDEGGETAGLLRLAAALVRMWWIRGHPSEGRRWLEHGLARAASDPAIPPAVIARAHQAAGNLARMQGDFERAQEHLEACLAIQRAHGDASEIAAALTYLAALLGTRGDVARAISLAEEGLGLRRALGDKRSIALSLGTLGELAFTAGELDAACQYIEEALALYRAVGDAHSIAISLNNLGEALRSRGDLARAAERFHEGLAVFRELGATHGVAYLLANLGDVARLRGDAATARQHYLEALPLFVELGYRDALLGVIAGLARLAAIHGTPEHVVMLFGAEGALRATMGFALVPSEQEEQRQTLALLRDRLPAAVFQAAWEAGSRMSLDEAVTAARMLAMGDPSMAHADAGQIVLSTREQAVARLAAEGYTNRQIAAQLQVSTRTVESHVANVLRKLGIASRRELGGWLAATEQPDAANAPRADPSA
jgi:predicted ATPase/DNA-binding SARP family transcriptional activator/DNA-binding CsgD family transcriptional regulator